MLRSLSATLLAFLLLGNPSLSAQDKPTPKVYEQAPEKLESQKPEPKEPAKTNAVDSKSLFADAPNPEWIWGSDPNATYRLATTFTSKANSIARVRVACDNACTIRVNGKTAGTHQEWQAPLELDIGPMLVDGENRIEAEVSNQGGPSGFLLQGVVLQGEKKSYLVSSGKWQATTTADSTPKESKVVAAYGSAPWGKVLDNQASTATQSGLFATLPGFQVERLFTVPKEELGSWVCLGVDPKGRLIASDQEGKGLCRITPPAIGDDSQKTKVEHLTVPITSAQGMLFAFDSLYLSVNGGPGSGLYRLRDTDGDDQYDEVKKLKDFRGGGEHGPHALRLSPDGKSIVVLCGNHTDPPYDVPEMKTNEKYRSRIPANWSEDHLLPRMWDANGHAVGRMAPGGWVAYTDPNGESWDVYSIGYRNPYDMDFNKDGELFVYDADMEWDIGSPWYRPTRVSHASSGSEFGWRSGTGKWPTYYADSLPPLVEIGPGSPVGVEFGFNATFPKKYQDALYICDWTFGTMYAIHMTPDGSSYRGTKEEFISRTPLPLTDVVIGKDGAMYFSVGGRGTQSELYRVTYTGPKVAPANDVVSREVKELRELRRWAETFHGSSKAHRKNASDGDIKKLIDTMGSDDRYVAYAARVALEAQDPSRWTSQIATAKNPNARIIGAIALAHQSDWTSDQLADLLMKIDIKSLKPVQEMNWHRALQVALARHGKPSEGVQAKLLAMLEPMFPRSKGPTALGSKKTAIAEVTPEYLDRELITELIFLESKVVVSRALAMMEGKATTGEDISGLLERNRGYGGAIADSLRNQPNQQEVHFAFMLRNAKVGWSTADKQKYFEWTRKAHQWSGGASYQKFIENIATEAFENSTDVERLAVETAGLRKPYQVPELPKPQGPGKDWQLDELAKLAEAGLQNRNLEKGAVAYAAVRCVVCHRFGGQGGSTGPDLTQAAGRFSQRDLIDAIINPSKVVSDQYRATKVVTDSGEILVGRVIAEDKEKITLLTDPENSTKLRTIPLKEIESRMLSEVSVMPKDLLNTLNQDEVLDLLAYLLSKGKR